MKFWLVINILIDFDSTLNLFSAKVGRNLDLSWHRISSDHIRLTVCIADVGVSLRV